MSANQSGGIPNAANPTETNPTANLGTSSFSGGNQSGIGNTETLAGKRAKVSWGSNLRNRFLLVIAVIAVVVGIGPVSKLLGGQQPTGPESSSYATTPFGLAAFADLAKSSGFRVEQLRTDLTDAALAEKSVYLSADDTLVVLGTTLNTNEQLSVRSFVEKGGRLIASGATDSWLENLANTTGTTNDDPTTERSIPVTNGEGSTIAIGGRGYWSGHEGTVLAGIDAQPVVVEQTVGAGKVIAVADSSFFDNTHLVKDDSAAFGLGLLGESNRTVYFAEAGHGYVDRAADKNVATGIPWRARWFLTGLGFAFLLWAISVGRRNGPPERPDRQLPPARVEYALAISNALRRQNRRRLASLFTGPTDPASTSGRTESSDGATDSDGVSTTAPTNFLANNSSPTSTLVTSTSPNNSTASSTSVTSTSVTSTPTTNSSAPAGRDQSHVS